jgi:hypothetical protein
MDIIKGIDNGVNSIMEPLLQQPTLIRGFIHLFLIVYAAKLAPMLPKEFLAVFDNAYFKLFVFSLILWTAQFSPSTSLLIALSFIMTANYLNHKHLWETMDNVPSSTVAPSHDMAVDVATTQVQKQVAATPVVDAVTHQTQTMVIQPTVVQTATGATVINPSVVLASAVVQSKDGQKVVVTPNVTVVDAPSSQPAAPVAPVAAVVPVVAAPAAATPAATVAPVDSMPVVGAPVVASVPAAPVAPAPVAAATPAAADETISCYPLRQVDLSKVDGYEPSDGAPYSKI